MSKDESKLLKCQAELKHIAVAGKILNDLRKDHIVKKSTDLALTKLNYEERLQNNAKEIRKFRWVFASGIQVTSRDSDLGCIAQRKIISVYLLSATTSLQQVHINHSLAELDKKVRSFWNLESILMHEELNKEELEYI
ncbi:hypothetical protein LAZ67_2000280 [Cordylochernes scorpioides]|uniref:Uncharacterized protein n=1 Tax=Cordylochernes scorpioides TaxID=51811 RepID=A0ABY6K170_9ARAC|nr:hypothetical protein LAZ67_2000280 [Cordylochernes scorpioides]